MLKPSRRAMPEFFDFQPSAEVKRLFDHAPAVHAMINKALDGYSPEHHGGSDEVRRAFEESDGKPHRFGRIDMHLARLCRGDHNLTQKVAGHPPDVEKRFALDFMEHAHKAIAGERGRAVFRALSSEGEGVNQFWTFAPYLHHQLTAGGLPAAESLEILLNWANDSMGPSDEVFSLPLARHLQGLSEWIYGHGPFALEPAGHREATKPVSREDIERRGFPTHEAAAALARELAPALRERYGKKKR